MDRTYSNSDRTSPDFFVGKELEHTKFFGQDTLFVVGNQPSYLVAKKLMEANLKELTPEITHVYLAANHSFKDFRRFDLINNLILSGLNVTFECDLPTLARVRNKIKPVDLDKFCLMLSIPLPEVDALKDIAVIKIDDSDTNRKNPGVWSHSLKSLLTDGTLTTWDAYGNDTIL